MSKSLPEIWVYLQGHIPFFHKLCCTFLGAYVTGLFANQRKIHWLFNIATPGIETRWKYATPKSVRWYLLLDFFLFTPAIVLLIYLSCPALIHRLIGYAMSSRSDYILLGIASYGFPLILVKDTVQRKILSAIRRELVILLKESPEETGKNEPPITNNEPPSVQEKRN